MTDLNMDDQNSPVHIILDENDLEEDEDDNELPLQDDAEEDLATILEYKINSELIEEQPYEIESLSQDAQEFLLIPKRLDEQHCQKCWLLVGRHARKCQVHYDDCPIFP